MEDCRGERESRKGTALLTNSSYGNDGKVLRPTDDDDGCAGQKSEQGEEHHLIAVYEAVQRVAALHANDRHSGC